MAKGKNSAVQIKPDEEWQVEDALRCLTRAKEIRADPKMMAKVKALARDKLEKTAQILGDTDEC